MRVVRGYSIGVFLWCLATASLASSWVQLPGAGNDIGVGANGVAWVIGNDPEAGGYGIYRWAGSNWSKVSGSAVRVDVDPQGNAWVVTSGGAIFRFDGSAFVVVKGLAKDIGIGANGSVWVIGSNPVPGGFGIYRWNGSAWDTMPGGAVRIDVDPQGNPWIAQDAGQIYRWDGAKWVLMPGLAKDIGIGANGAVWVVGVDNGVYQWTGSTWEKRDGILTSISVDHQGKPWGVNPSRQLWAFGGATSQMRSRNTNVLRTNESLKTNEYLVSANGQYTLAMQPDAQACVYKGREKVWCGGPNATQGDWILTVQGDGNMCIRNVANGQNVWCIASVARPISTGYVARLGDNGNLVVWAGVPGESVSIWDSRYGGTGAPGGNNVIVRNMRNDAASWVTVYEDYLGNWKIYASGCVEAGMTRTFSHEMFGKKQNNQNIGYPLRVRAEQMWGTDGKGGDCSAGKFCDTDMLVTWAERQGKTVYSHKHARAPTMCYVSYNPVLGYHSRSVKNTYADKAVWITIYDGGFPAKITDAGCVPPNATREWIHDVFADYHRVRAEVMTGLDCRGTKVCDTEGQPGGGTNYPGGVWRYQGNPYLVRAQANNNCYIDWN